MTDAHRMCCGARHTHAFNFHTSQKKKKNEDTQMGGGGGGGSSHVITGPTYLIVIQYVAIHMLHVMTAVRNKCKYKYVELKQRNYIQT